MLSRAFNLPARMTPVTDEHRRDTESVVMALCDPALPEVAKIGVLRKRAEALAGEVPVSVLDRTLDLALSVQVLQGVSDRVLGLADDLFLQAWVRHPNIPESGKAEALRKLMLRSASAADEGPFDPFIAARFVQTAARMETLTPVTRSRALGGAQRLMGSWPSLANMFVEPVLRGLCHEAPVLYLQAQAVAHQMLTVQPDIWRAFEGFFRLGDAMYEVPPLQRRGEQLVIGAALEAGVVPVRAMEPLVVAGLSDRDQDVREAAVNNANLARDMDPGAADRLGRFMASYANSSNPEMRAVAARLAVLC